MARAIISTGRGDQSEGMAAGQNRRSVSDKLSRAAVARQPGYGFSAQALKPVAQWSCVCGQPNLARNECCSTCGEPREETA